MLLFTYGTLKHDGHYFPLIEKEIKLINDNCYTKGVLISLGKYPGLADGMGVVWGELFDISEEGLKICDEVEEYSSIKEANKNLYYREQKDIFDSEGSLIDSAIVYIFNSTKMSFEWKNKNCELKVKSNLIS